MKKLLALLLVLAMVFSLAACGADTAKTDEPAETPAEETVEETPPPPIPSGLFMLLYIGDEDGEYVEEFNTYEDFYGRPVDLIEMMHQNCETLWCDIAEDGTGTFYSTVAGEVPMDLNTGEPDMLLLDGELTPYRYDEAAGRLWISDGDVSWDVMEACTQEALDLVFEGKGGSVPLAEAELGDLVCMGTYETIPGNDVTEPLFWRVIDKDGDNLLLLCDKLIDSFSYNYNPDQTNLDAVTWENCSLRSFLNDPEYFLSCFTEEEIARMQTTHLENKAANEELIRQWGMLEDRGDATYSELGRQDRADDPETDDRVFLLSYQEVLKYFGEAEDEYTEDNSYPFAAMKMNPDWIAYVTEAVMDNGSGYFDYSTGGGAWLTRTLSSASPEGGAMATYITGGGQVFNYFTYVPLFIRPAMWVSAAD